MSAHQATLFSTVEETTDYLSKCCGQPVELHYRYRILLRTGFTTGAPRSAFVCTVCGRAVGDGA